MSSWRSYRNAYLLHMYLPLNDPARNGTGWKSFVWWMGTRVIPFAIMFAIMAMFYPT